MAIGDVIDLKVKLNYELGSYTFGNIARTTAATDEKLYELAMALNSVQNEVAKSVSKIRIVHIA